MSQPTNGSPPDGRLRLGMSPPEWFVLLTVIVVGSVFVSAIPLGAGWDEETHLIRAWELASLHFVPNALPRNQLPFPAFYWQESYRRDFLIRTVDRSFNAKFAGAPIDVEGYIYSELPTRSAYSPLLLAPQALAIRYLGQARDLPALTVFHASRFFGLLTYCALVWAAVRVTPIGKWTFALSATLPTSLFQASTVSADPVSTGIGLLFVALCLRLSTHQRIGWKGLGVLAVAIGLLFNAKPNMALLVLLPFMLLKPSKFDSHIAYAALVILSIVLALVEIGGWEGVVHPYVQRSAEGANPVQQIRFLAGHPFSGLKVILVDLGTHGVEYLRQLIAAYGYDYWFVPVIVYPLYLLGLLAAVFADSLSGHLPAWIRRWLLGTFAFGVVGTLLSLYLANTPVGAEQIVGVQGRYFAALLPLVLVAAAGEFAHRRSSQKSSWIAGSLCGVAIVVYSLALVLSYHVTCGSAFYRVGLCFQPVYKNWAPDASYSPPISGGFRLSQEIIPECNGAAQVRVWVDAAEAATESGIELRVLDATANRVLYVGQRSSDLLPSGGWLAVDFEPDWNSDGKLYRIEIEPWSRSDAPSARIAYTVLSEYDQGAMLENGSPSEVDTVFNYGCLMGLQRLITPGGTGGRN